MSNNVETLFADWWRAEGHKLVPDSDPETIPDVSWVDVLSAFEGDTKSVLGETVDVVRNGEFGVEVGKVRCPVCTWEMDVGVASPPLCKCGLEWSIECNAVGRKPQ